MGKYSAQVAFDRLAADLKEKIARALAASDFLEIEKRQMLDDTDLIIKKWRRDHNYALDIYYGVDRTRNIKSALRNDLTKGGIET